MLLALGNPRLRETRKLALGASVGTAGLEVA